MKMIKNAPIIGIVLAAIFILTACSCKHEEVIDAGIPSTCTTTGLTEGKHCSLCNEVLVAQTEIPVTGHTEEVIPAVDATCTTTGLTEGRRCSLCNEVLVAQTEIPATGHTEEVIPAVDATCTTKGSTEGKKCTTCNEILVASEEVAVLGHTTTTGTCSRCNVSFGLFTTSYYVDEFNQPTKDSYVTNKNYISGTFSNSATTDSLLYVQILVDKEDIAIFLHEYGRNTVKNSSSRYVEEYNITMKTSDGTKHSLTGTIYCGSDRLFIDEKYEQKVLDALKSGETVSFYIVQSDRTTTTYLFSVNTSNFAEMYKSMTGM